MGWIKILGVDRSTFNAQSKNAAARHFHGVLRLES
jgi:hypothetical protein